MGGLQGSGGSSKGKNHLENLGVNWRIILKLQWEDNFKIDVQ
jgi:hypothetical protein